MCLSFIAAIEGSLGQHEHDDASGQPVLTDPKFIVYEKARNIPQVVLCIYSLTTHF